MGDNIKLTDEDYAFIKSLEKFDMVMLLSEINAHGWDSADTLLQIMKTVRRKECN